MTRRKAIRLSSETRMKLMEIAKSRTMPAAEVRRAKILLALGDGQKISEIAGEMKVYRPLIERIIDKAQAFGVLAGLKDLPRPGRPREITDDAKSWVLSLACQKPVALGYAAETWTYSLLIKHLRRHCEAAGYPKLSRIDKGGLHDILSKGNIKPHKISYYLENRDPEFEEKMAGVLFVYKEVELQRLSPETPQQVATISYDEKPSIQAIRNIAADLAPVPGRYAAIGRDHEYKRQGTVTLLAGIDLHIGHIIPLVRERHRSKEFIEFLKKLDDYYPPDWQIRVILDNHSAHISKETQAYLRTVEGRFEFIFTPKHGSWLNMIELFFSKISRSFLRQIRVNSKEELIERIYQGIEEINREPVIFRWKYKMDEIAFA